MAKEKLSNLSPKKKTRKLFWGTLGPLVVVALAACAFFYSVSNQILGYYAASAVQSSVEKLNSSILEKIDPVVLNLQNFSNFASLTDDDAVIEALVNTLAKSMEQTESLYYTSTTPLSDGGVFFDSTGWVPPSSYEPSNRSWYKAALENKGQLCFSNPYIDADTGKSAVTVSITVNDTKGNVRGVVGCDLIVDDFVYILRQVTVSPNAQMDIINAEGLFMTNKDSSKVLKAHWKDETAFPGDMDEWLNGETKTTMAKNTFFAVAKVGPAPWFITVEGPISDFNRALKLTIIVFQAVLLLFSFVCSVINIRNIIKMREGEKDLGAALFEETQTLVVAAKENAATSQDQSAAVKEIVATMEDSNALSENIAQKIRDVSRVADKTSSDVRDGVASIDQNVSQLHAIFDANQQTIDGMKILSDKIESIWDIVTLINNVADQAKIIAFNAELEASSAGEAGKSFRIVANEIRRLSDGIIDGTKEIKEKINEIQHSSDALIIASESGTEKINAGYENAKSLGERFASIKDSAEITAQSAENITEIIQQQTNSSEQILIALKQISAGVENFAVATDNISASSEHIRKMSEELNNSVKANSIETNSSKEADA